MKKIAKVTAILSLMIFSFYYTEKIAVYVQNNTPLKKEIIAFKENNPVSTINAKIDGEYIIPGISGLEVNVDKSYNAMKTYNVFSEANLVYDKKKPDISISDYPDKIITKGNPAKNAVSILISPKNKNMSYFNSLNIKYSLIDKSNYCIILETNGCSSSKNSVQPSVILSNTNFAKNISCIDKGSIIYIEDNLDERNIDVLIKQINFHALNILDLDDHISETYIK